MLSVRAVQENRGDHLSLWAAVELIAPKIGYAPQTPLEWVKRAEIDSGRREGMTLVEREPFKGLEREVKEFGRANWIPRNSPSVNVRAACYRFD